MFNFREDIRASYREPDDPGRLPAMIVTAIGLICFICMLAAAFHWSLPDFGSATAPAPEPDIQITATVGTLDEIAVIQYYNHIDYPDGPPVNTGAEIEYGGDTYTLFRVAPGLISTDKGDCWEVVFRK